MGRMVEIRNISVSLSRHNSERDVEDDRRFDELLDKIQELCRQYPDIHAEVW